MDGIRFAYAKNRAEELGRDILAQFVVPLFYDSLEVRKQTKSFILIGGRGCGKTTLLRYLSHNTQFSPNKPKITQDDLAYIGLYLRADTNFLSSLQGGGVDDKTWKAAFNHSLACDLAIEVLDCLQSINCTEKRIEAFGGLDRLHFEDLRSFDSDIGSTETELRRYLVGARDKLAIWVNNLDVVGKKPLFLPGEIFVKRVIQVIQEQLKYLQHSLFAIFVDEYENLHSYQQRIINGLIKHGEHPLVFNVAVKRNGMPINQTDGNESIQNVADFREIDLEDRQAQDFPLFAAELLFARLHEYQGEQAINIPIDPALLQDVGRVGERRGNETYKNRIIAAAREMLPRLSEKDVAAIALKTERIRDRLRRNLIQGLKQWNSQLSPEKFLRDEVPDASVICGALLNRNNERPEIILAELEAYSAGKDGRFKDSEWIHNNLFGCVLQLYSSGQTTCPLFAGFDNFVLMARNNPRYFLELIHSAFIRIEDDALIDKLTISVEHQVEAVHEASSTFVREVRGCGTFGNQLHGMVLTLGAVFRVKQQGIAQSEPEINHFHILSGTIDGQLEGLLKEAVKWSVLLEEEETKKKATGAKNADYILNPVFSGHFQISYRKKRSLPVSTLDLKTMFMGDIKDRDGVVRRLVGDDVVTRNLELDLGIGDG